MRKRRREVLTFVLDHPKADFTELLSLFSVSKRTLYYDIEFINQQIKEFGHIAIINQELIFIGRTQLLREFIETFNESSNEQISGELLLYELLKQDIEEVCSKYALTQDEVLTEIEPLLSKLNLKFDKVLLGDELVIRNEFIRLMHYDNNILNTISDTAKSINKSLNLNLSDYSLSFLSGMIEFIKYRSEYVPLFEFNWIDQEDKPIYHDSFKQIIELDNKSEARYLCAYILSLSTVSNLNSSFNIYEITRKLVLDVSLKTNIDYFEDEQFIKNLYNHLLSSYYRIKYQFPIVNPLLENVKENNMYMFYLIKQVFTISPQLHVFRNISDDEIAFVTIYFVSYARLHGINTVEKKRVLIVCPYGLMISKSIETQLIKSIPGINIVDTISALELENYSGNYDFIVTTNALKDLPNSVVVNPILSSQEINEVYEMMIQQSKRDIDYQKLLNIISKSCTIINQQRLTEDLFQYFNPNTTVKRKEREGLGPMLSELVNENRAQTVERVNDWQEAIKVAAKPLLDEGCIDTAYIDKMIGAIHQHGPYVILAERFALPHANNSGDVHELSMSLLRLENDVDFLGQPVSTIMVLATIDSDSHLRALTSLAELLYVEENLKTFTNESTEEILKLIRSNDQKEEVKE